MADSIVRLKVDSQEYDQKLRRAAEGLQRYADGCRQVGGTLSVVEQETLDFVKAVGQMDTVSRTATGKLAEMNKAFIELSMQYKQMTDEEKQSPFGRALSQSLDQLKTRINDSKTQLNDVKESLNGSSGLSGALDSVAGKFGLNIGQLTKFGGALALAKGALETVKGAIESTEAGHDQLARAIAVTDNITNQFLRSLATADFSNFINGLQGIIDKTIDAYNAMDEFESYAARFQPWQQAQEGEIQTKLMQARAAKAKGENDRAEKLNKEAKDLINQLAESTKAYGEKQTKGGFSTIRSLMGGVDISDQQIAWYADPRNWEQAKQKAQQFANTQERIKQLEKDIRGYRRPGETEMGYTMRVGAAQMEKNRLEEMLRRDQSLKRAYTMQNLRDSGDSEQAQALKQAFSNIYGNKMAENRVESLMARADRMEGVLSRSALGGGGGGGKGGGTTKAEVQAVSGSIDEQTKLVQELQKAWRAAADDDSRQKIKAEIEEQQYLLDRMTGKENFDPTKIQELTDLRGKQLTLTVTSDAKDALEKVKAIEGVTIDDKTFDVTAETAEALRKLREIDGFKISPKTIEVTEESRPDFSSDMKRGKNGKWYDETAPVAPDTIKFSDGLQKLMDYMEKQQVDDYKKRQSRDEWDDTKKVVSGLNQVASGLQQMGIELPKGVQQVLGMINGLMTVIEGVNTIIGVTQTTALSANTAAMVALTSALYANTAVSAIPFYANGGVVRAAVGFQVPGNHFSGDMVPALLNSGETVLNRAQQGNLVSQLEGANGRSVNVRGVLQGEQIFLAAERWSKRTGKGEIVTW